MRAQEPRGPKVESWEGESVKEEWRGKVRAAYRFPGKDEDAEQDSGNEVGEVEDCEKANCACDEEKDILRAEALYERHIEV
jgi:hypothetical protein